MDLVEAVKAVLDRLIGTGGALRNCVIEREARATAEEQVRLLGERLGPALDIQRRIGA